MTGPTEYRIEHVRDLLAIPRDKMDACLADLRLWVMQMRHLDAIMDSLGDLYKIKITEIIQRGLVWVDDGKTGCSRIDLTFVDAETCEAAGMTPEERKNIEHALLHLKANKIADDDKPVHGGGWYSGNREHFVERHRKAIAMFLDMLSAGVAESEALT